jgi:hypothetical protein
MSTALSTAAIRRHAPERPAFGPDLDDLASGDGRRLFWPAVLLFLAIWLAFAWPWLSGRVTIPWDAKAHFLPQVQFLAASIWRGEWPFWTPNVFSGHPQIADPQSQMFSPPMLLLALVNHVPGSLAIDTTVMLCLAMAGFGILLLFREHGWHPAGGLVAALAFSFGAAMAWRLQHYGQVLSLAYLPFAIVLLRRALMPGAQTGRVLSGCLAGIVSGFIVDGRDQIALLEVYLLAGYALSLLLGGQHDLPTRLRTSVAPLTAGVAGGVLVALVPVVLTALLAADSNRPEIDLEGAGRGSLHPALLLTTIAPHLFGAAGEMADYWGPPSLAWQGTGLFIAQNVGQSYIGAVPLILIIAGVVRGDLWSREIRFFSVALVLSLVYALGWYTPGFRLMYDLLPGVSLYRRPADAVFLVGGLSAILAGYAMHRIVSETSLRFDRKRAALIVATILLAFAAAIAVAYHMDRLELAMLPLLLAAGCFLVGLAAIAASDWLRPIRPLVALAIPGLVAGADLVINNGPNGASGLPPSLVAMLEPDTANETVALLKRKVAETRSETRRDRIELAGLGFHWPNASMTHGLENTLGYNPVRLALYSAATGAEDHVGLPDQRRFSPLMPSYRSRLADLLGLRFIATGVPIERVDRSLPPSAFKLIARTKDAYVYENTSALPRVLFAQEALPADFGAMLRDGRWPSFDATRTVLLAHPPGRLPRRVAGHVRIISYRNTEVVIEADSLEGGWVVLNDVWHPWWRAEIDGRPAGLLRANVLFRAVEVPAGRHRVRMVFEPIRGALAQIRSEMWAPASAHDRQ